MTYKGLFHIILFLFVFQAEGQNSRLAQQFYSQGEFDKAAVEYKNLWNKFPYHKDYFYKLVDCYQKQGLYQKAADLLQQKKEQKNPVSQVWLGYNFLLQKDSIRAQRTFDKAIKAALKSTISVFQTGKALQEIYQLDKALELYTSALEKYPRSTFDLEMARIYAEKNRPAKMMSAYMNYLDKYPENLSRVRYLITPYLSNANGNVNLDIIRLELIRRIKQKPEAAYYRLLEWLYIQEKNYRKAFYQLRSLYSKKEAGIDEIYYLAQKALENKKTETARLILSYVIEHSDKPFLIEKAKLSLLEMDLKNKFDSDASLQEQFNQYFKEKWRPDNRTRLFILYADFLTFHKNTPEEAQKELKKLLAKPLPRFMEAEVKLKQADIAVQQGFFNQALLLYTQVQLDFPNHSLGHLATYKIAQVSFFKGDIDWAHNQLKVIKSVHSDLISNDAIDLDMLIINNKEENDSLQTGLKQLAKVKYLIYKNQRKEALNILDSIRTNFKGQNIYDDALWMQALLYEQNKNYHQAADNYKEIINLPNEIIYKDEAIFRLAKLYENELDRPEEAKKLYKQIIIEYPSSFWFPDAQRAYRRLRGDDL